MEQLLLMLHLLAALVLQRQNKILVAEIAFMTTVQNPSSTEGLKLAISFNKKCAPKGTGGIRSPPGGTPYANGLLRSMRCQASPVLGLLQFARMTRARCACGLMSNSA
jgi:hypothetical protein